MYYAQLNGSDIVVAVTQTAGPFDQPNMIPVDSLDATLLGKHYNRDTQTFSVAPVQE